MKFKIHYLVITNQFYKNKSFTLRCPKNNLSKKSVELQKNSFITDSMKQTLMETGPYQQIKSPSFSKNLDMKIHTKERLERYFC